MSTAIKHDSNCMCAICVADRENIFVADHDHHHEHHHDHEHHDHHHEHHEHDHGSSCGCSTHAVAIERPHVHNHSHGDASHEHHHHAESCGCATHEHHHHGDTCGCESHSHDHEHDGCACCSEGTVTLDRTLLTRIGLSAVLIGVGVFAPLADIVRLGVFLVSLVIIGYDIMLSAVKGLFVKRILDENLLMTIACIGAFCIGEYSEGVLVMLLYQTGEMFQAYAVGNSRKSIRALVDLRPETVNVSKNGEIISVPAGEVRVGDIMVIKPGERIALDGIVVEGESTLDTSALTGESLARSVEIGEKALSGCVNQTGLLKVRVEKLLEQSAVSRILEMVEEAAEKKAEPEKFITKFAKVYTPCVFVAAIAVALIPPLAFGLDWYTWIYRALTFLVISCPCALVISVPLTYFAGIGGASKKGVLFKGSNSMDVMSGVGTVVFDKTGTLTTGKFQVTDVFASQKFDSETVLAMAAYVESYSDHPLAKSIVSSYGKEIDKTKITDYQEKRGKGVRALIDGKCVMAGNKGYISGEGIEIAGEDLPSSTTVYVAVDGKFAGSIALGDTNKADAKETIDSLNSQEIKSVMLTGDNKSAAEKTAKSLGLSDYYAECLPEDKSRLLDDIMDKQGSVAFVGDGINDAPVLALADVGIAMGGLGADAAIEAADVVIMNDEPSKVLDAIRASRKTKRIVIQNITFALVIKALFLILGALGYSAMATAIFADVGVALLAVLNAMRASRNPTFS